MRLRLDQLQQVVKRTLDEERNSNVLRQEIGRALGPSVIIEGRLSQVAESANERIDVMERTGKANYVDFKPSVMVKFIAHADPEVRKLAARTVPQRFLSKMVNDSNHSVRAAVAKRLPTSAIREMLRRFSNDENIRLIYRERRLAEAGLPKPKQVDAELDINGERLGDAVKQAPGAELSERWYRSCAFTLMQDYRSNVDAARLGARRFVSSTKATSGVEIDESKLLKALDDIVEEREDNVLERDSLKETLRWLRGSESREMMNEAVMPIIEEDVDHVRDLLESNTSAQAFIDAANTLFRISEANLPSGIRKYRLGEAGRRSETVPVVGYLPHSSGFRSVDERTLDAYCSHWNDRQRLRGEPLRLEWSTHPDAVGKVSFNVTLR